MAMDSAALGAVFFVSLALSAWSGDSAALDRLNASQATFAGALLSFGVGATISLLGNSVWNVVFPYEADEVRVGPLSRPARGTRSTWAGQHATEAYAAATELGAGPREAASLATSLVLYSEAPDRLLEWIRRRHASFSNALNATLALILGAVVSLALTSDATLGRVLVWLVELLVAFITIRAGRRQRREAEEMERLWFALRTR